MNDPIEKFGGRKFWLVVVVMITTLGLLIANKIGSEVFQNIIQLIILVYMSGNVAQSLVTKTIEVETVADTEQTTSTITNRKFWLVVVIFAITVVLMAIGQITSDVYTNISYWIITGYVSGNVVQKMAANGISIAGTKLSLIK